MPAFTSFLNLYKPGGGSTGAIAPDEVADIDRLNANFDAIDAFAASWGLATSKNQGFVGLAADRGAVTGMKRGDTYQETDGDFDRYAYDGSNWKNRSQVSLSITSTTSVTNGTVTLAWSDSQAAYYRDNGGFWASGAPTEITLKRAGWYRISYTVRGNGVAGISVTGELNGVGQVYLASAGVGAAGASTTAQRVVDMKVAAGAKLVIKATSTAGQTGTHNLIVEYLGED